MCYDPDSLPSAEDTARELRQMKRLSASERDAYLAGGQWRGKAGGYAVQGIAGSFVVKMVGSYTNVVGLPLYETWELLAPVLGLTTVEPRA